LLRQTQPFNYRQSVQRHLVGQAVVHGHFLATAGLFEGWVQDCPLRYTSPNAPLTRDVLGTLMLGILAGSRRYAHIAGVRGDAVAAKALGLNGMVSEDSVRRALKAMAPAASEPWMREALMASGVEHTRLVLLTRYPQDLADDDQRGRGDFCCLYHFADSCQSADHRPLLRCRCPAYHSHRRVRRATVVNQLPADIRQIFDAHVDDKGACAGGQFVPSHIRLLLARCLVAGDKSH
jgi:hypothetical protein